MCCAYDPCGPPATHLKGCGGFGVAVLTAGKRRTVSKSSSRARVQAVHEAAFLLREPQAAPARGARGNGPRPGSSKDDGVPLQPTLMNGWWRAPPQPTLRRRRPPAFRDESATGIPGRCRPRRCAGSENATAGPVVRKICRRGRVVLDPFHLMMSAAGVGTQLRAACRTGWIRVLGAGILRSASEESACA